MFWEREDIQGQTLRCWGNFRHSVSTINMGDTWGTERHCPSWSHHRAENTGASFSHLLHSPTICPTQPRPGMLWTLGNRSREDRLPLLKHCGLEHILNNSRSYLGLFHRERGQAGSLLPLSQVHPFCLCVLELQEKLPLEEGRQGRLDLKMKTEFPLFIGV